MALWGCILCVFVLFSRHDIRYWYDQLPSISLSPLPPSPLPAHPTPIDRQHLPTDVLTRIPCQEHDRTLEVLWLAPSTRRYPLENLPRPRLIPNECLIHVCIDVTRCDRVDLDPFARPLVAQCLCQLRHSALGCCVRRDSNAALERKKRCYVDDIASCACCGCLFGQEIGPKVPTQCENRCEVDL